MAKRIIFTTLLFVFGILNNAKAEFVYTSNCVEAQQLIYQLKFKQAQKLIDAEKAERPNNGVIPLLENYIDFLTIIVNEKEEEFKLLEKNKSARISAVKSNDKQSPFYNFVLAEINFQWAIARLKFSENMTAALELKETYNLLYDNIEDHPDFLLSYKTYGILRSLVGTVPDKYQWIVNTLGFNGSINDGITKVNKVAKADGSELYLKPYKYEAGLIEAAMQLHLNKNKDTAWLHVKELTKDYYKNLLSNFFRANIAMRSGRNDIAIEVLSSKPRNEEYHSFYYLDYMLGLAKLQRLDKGADIHFKVYTTFFKGVNYIKSAYQKIAWYNLVNGNESNYKRYMYMCRNFGNDKSEDDKQALKEGNDNVIPNKDLLMARLLFDGGYYLRAEEVLKYKSIIDFDSDKDQVEFVYRKARIADELNKTDQAIEFYKNTMVLGENLPYYFAANSSLQLGLIFEKKGDLDQSEYYYKKCKTFDKNKQYKNSIEQKAKTGLKRIEEKRAGTQ